MNSSELDLFKQEIISAIKTETHEAIKNTGHTWVVEAVEKTVPAVFIKLGLDYEKPLEAQKDFAFLRQSRSDSEDRKKVIIQTATKWITTFCLSAVAAGTTVWVAMQNKP